MGYKPITLKKYNYRRKDKYQSIFKEIIREAKEKKYYFIRLTLTLSSSFHNFKKGEEEGSSFALNPKREKDLNYKKEIDILEGFEKKLLDNMRRKGKRIPDIKYISVLEMHASLDFHSHLILMIPSSPRKGKKREHLEQFHKSFQKAKENFKGEIGKISKKILSYKKEVKVDYLLKSISVYRKKED